MQSHDVPSDGDMPKTVVFHQVDLPTMYAVSSKDGDDAHMFNCVQRGHQQALETLPSVSLSR